MRTPAAALLAVLLLAGCSDDATPNDAAASAAPTPTGSAAATTADPYTALTPPTSPGVGSFSGLVASRAYLQAQGLLALQVLEPDTVTGKNTATLTSSLRGRSEDLTVQRDLAGSPTEAGLKYRPLFAGNVTVGDRFAEVVRSSWSAEEVRGGGGENALRVSWDGALRYTVSVDGQPRQAAYALTFSYVYALLDGEPNGIVLETAIAGNSHVAPAVGACLSKGLVLPTGTTPSETDFGKGPYPAPAAGACPV